MYLRNLISAIVAWWHDTKKLELLAFLLGGDRFFNAVAGGDFRFTVSGRVGAFANRPSKSRYWQILQWLIDQSFYPIEGPRHCWRAFRWEQQVITRERRHRRANDFGLFMLSIFVFAGCCLIAPIVYLLSFRSKSSRS